MGWWGALAVWHGEWRSYAPMNSLQARIVINWSGVLKLEELHPGEGSRKGFDTNLAEHCDTKEMYFEMELLPSLLTVAYKLVVVWKCASVLPIFDRITSARRHKNANRLSKNGSKNRKIQWCNGLSAVSWKLLGRKCGISRGKDWHVTWKPKVGWR